MASGKSLQEVHESIDTTKVVSKGKRLLAFLGPAYLVSVGYMDPGNWATDLAGGSRYGYSLLWVLLMSNIMAIFLQGLSARLGIVRGLDLAQANRETYPPVINFFLYVLAELAIAACDLAEVLGMAIGIQLLTGLPLMWGVLITVADTFLLLMLQRYGMRAMEAFIIGLVAVVSVSFLVEMLFAKPNLREVITGFVPTFRDSGALYIAIGIIGATVMPHNLYLHSALVQTRKVQKNEAGVRDAIRMNFIDSAVALNIAFLVNAAILILAATVFYKQGYTGVAEIHDAHALLGTLMGTPIAPALFAIALIAAGQSSTITGTLAGQIIMEGYLNLRINPWLRRIITRLLAILPAVITLLIFGESKIGELLIFSQVILSAQLGFAVIPLIHFVSDKTRMGSFAIGMRAKVFAWLVGSVILILNTKLVINEAGSFLAESHNIVAKAIVIIVLAGMAALLLATIVYPLRQRRALADARRMHLHRPPLTLADLTPPLYERIAVALDFSERDAQVLRYALAQGSPTTTYYLVHIVESASAKILGTESDDFETRSDKQHLDTYVQLLQAEGKAAIGIIGYRNRVTELVRIITEVQADLWVVGAHGHRGMSDWLYGETVNQVRHQLKIPVLVVQGEPL